MPDDTDMHLALAHYRHLIVSYRDDDLESTHRLHDREWQSVFKQAAGDAIAAGATSEALQEIEDAYP